jgi:hypothetical protein
MPFPGQPRHRVGLRRGQWRQARLEPFARRIEQETTRWGEVVRAQKIRKE